MWLLNARRSSIASIPATAALTCAGVMLGNEAASKPQTYSWTQAALEGYAAGPLACCVVVASCCCWWWFWVLVVLGF
jgi:hypothetical protein